MMEVMTIEKKEISGLKNPKLFIEGQVKNKDFTIEVLADGEPIEYQLEYFNNNHFALTVFLTRNMKDIQGIVKVGEEEKLVFDIKNTSFKRMQNKIKSLLFKPYQTVNVIFVTLKRGIGYLWKEYHFLVPPSLWKKFIKEFFERIKVKDLNLYYNPFNVIDYNKWLKENEEFNEDVELKYQPLISLLIPVYNIGKTYLEQCLESILNQTYQNFEIILVDDCSTNEETLETLKKYEQNAKITVKYRKENGHISRATNDALKLAKGEFVGLIDNDDVISPHALYEVVKVLNEDKTWDLIYSDEDKLNLDGLRCDPNFKSDFAPDTLLSSNYICHFTVLRKSIMVEIKGFRVGYEGAQDYDLFLRFTEKTNRIKHIPKILYHWRMVPGSTSMVIDNKNYALERGQKALEDALKRRKIKGQVHIHPNCPYYYIEYDIEPKPLVSIIIPTKDYADITEECLNTIYEKTTYPNFEIILVNNNSQEKKTFDLFAKFAKEHSNFQVVDANFEFNYSKINNMAVKKSKGDYLLLLNNDIKVITPNWLEIMLGYAMQSHIGAVGAKLIYPDETIQHGGVIVGLGGVAGHAYVDVPRNANVWGGRLSVPTNYSAVTAACLMIKKTKYKEVKGLEEDLKVAFNDVDFNLKLCKKGYYNVFLPQVELYHYESKSRGLDNTTEKYKRFVTEVEYMTKKWGKTLENDPFYNKNYSLRKSYMLDKKKRKEENDENKK